jgi:hypothetical protein
MDIANHEITKITESFLKEAYKIDGTCKFIEIVNIQSSLNLTPDQAAIFKLQDSQRGTFYITLGSHVIIPSKIN